MVQDIQLQNAYRHNTHDAVVTLTRSRHRHTLLASYRDLDFVPCNPTRSFTSHLFCNLQYNTVSKLCVLYLHSAGRRASL
jgi:hypothetical protein